MPEKSSKLTTTQKLVALAFLLTAGVSLDAQVLWSEGFETDGNGSRYTVTNGFFNTSSTPSQAYFARVLPSDIFSGTVGVGGPGYSNTEGDYLFAGANKTDGGGDVKWITFDPIDTTGFTDLTFSGAFGSTSNPADNHFEYPDGVAVFYRATGDTDWSSDLFFLSNNPNGIMVQIDPVKSTWTSAETVDQTTFTNIGQSERSGPTLSTALTVFNMTLPDTDSLEFRILMSVSSANEQVGFDNLQVSGTAIPEPNSYALLFGCMGLTWTLWRRWRRKK